MTKKPISFRERMDIARPDVVERRKRNCLKSTIAMQLRALRDVRGMTQDDVAQATGMTTVKIAQMESLVGAFPGIKDLERFADVCGGRIEVMIWPDRSDLPAGKPESFP
ncbi:helix-turn-helix transcriptional regulator [uncultured Sulfitobacter sp.]|uniref:helix-turn-helix domain-containing protein n=1 Tax=uncultured Sulfitobacter sp. TaxID=191468 RepID=UPI00344E8655